MTLPASGQIAFSDINNLIGHASGANIDMNWVRSYTIGNPTDLNSLHGKNYYSNTWTGSTGANGNCNCNCGNCQQNCGYAAQCVDCVDCSGSGVYVDYTAACTNCNNCYACNCGNCGNCSGWNCFNCFVSTCVGAPGSNPSYIQSDCNCWTNCYNCNNNSYPSNCNCLQAVNIRHHYDCANCSDCTAVTCFMRGTKILLADGTFKNIEDFVGNEKVMGLRGINTVLHLEHVILGVGRQIIEIGPDKLLASDDHGIWSKKNNKEMWGTFNYSHWRLEMDEFGKTHEIHEPNILNRNANNTLAHISGWVEAIPKYRPEFPTNTIIYHLITDKGSYIANGLVVASTGHFGQDRDFQWKGI